MRTGQGIRSAQPDFTVRPNERALAEVATVGLSVDDLHNPIGKSALEPEGEARGCPVFSAGSFGYHHPEVSHWDSHRLVGNVVGGCAFYG